MMHRVLSMTAALALVVFAGLAVAADKSDKADDTHSGVVVSAGDGKLTMTDKDGKNEHTYTVAKDAKITSNGKESKLENLKKGTTVVVVVVVTGDTKAISSIDATPASDSSSKHTGVVQSVDNGKLTMTDKDGKNEQTYTVARDAKITSDGKESKLEHLKKGVVVVVVVVVVGGETVVANIDAVASDSSSKQTGVVQSVADGKLAMTDRDGKNEHTYSVAKDAKIACNGKDCKLEDLRKGTTVVVVVVVTGGTSAISSIDATLASDKDKPAKDKEVIVDKEKPAKDKEVKDKPTKDK